MRTFLLILVVIFILPRGSSAESLTIAVAANIQYPFQELKVIFQTQTGVIIKEVIGSSGKLTAQIEQGAPFDIFLSADTDHPKMLYDHGLAHNEPQIYAYGTLVLWTFKDLDLSKGIEVLRDPSLQRIAIPLPKTAPYGREAVNVLRYYGLVEDINKKLVYGESIAQVNWFVTTGASDIGFTSKSSVLSDHMQGQGKWGEIEGQAYSPIAQAAVILKYAEKHNLKAAQTFFEFLFSKEARDIYQKYGYIENQ